MGGRGKNYKGDNNYKKNKNSHKNNGNYGMDPQHNGYRNTEYSENYGRNLQHKENVNSFPPENYGRNPNYPSHNMVLQHKENVNSFPPQNIVSPALLGLTPYESNYELTQYERNYNENGFNLQNNYHDSSRNHGFESRMGARSDMMNDLSVGGSEGRGYTSYVPERDVREYHNETHMNPSKSSKNLQYESMKKMNQSEMRLGNGHPNKGAERKQKDDQQNYDVNDVRFCLDCEKAIYKNHSGQQHRGHKITGIKEGIDELAKNEIEKSMLIILQNETYLKSDNDTKEMINFWNNVLKSDIDYTMEKYERELGTRIEEITNINKKFNDLIKERPHTIQEFKNFQSKLNGYKSSVNYKQPSWFINNMLKISLGMILENKKEVLCIIRNNKNPKYATLELQGDRILIHSYAPLTSKSTPDSSYTLIPHEYIHSLLERDTYCAFMKISYENKEIGTIFLNLDKETFSGQQFMALCSGEKGLSYQNSKFFRSCLKGKTGHHIWGGDYSRNDGTGGNRVLKKDVPLTRSPRPITEGLVASRFGYEDDSTIFRIYLKGLSIQSKTTQLLDDFGFGQVTQGLDVLSHISDLEDISKAKISNVGMVLTL